EREHCLNELIRIVQAANVRARLAQHVLVAKDLFPDVEISRDQRFPGGLQLEPSDQKQKRRGRSEYACGRTRGGIRTSQGVIENSQSMRIGKIYLLISIHPRKHVKVSHQPALVPGQQLLDEGRGR